MYEILAEASDKTNMHGRLVVRGRTSWMTKVIADRHARDAVKLGIACSVASA